MMTWCGVVAIDKPAGWTSRQVVNHIAKIVRPAKVGHAGTLDPLATGVLVIAIGPATRLISYLQQGQKRYAACFRLGQRSNTDDVEGQVVDGGDWSAICEHDVANALKLFVGVIQQIPPQFSAVHVDGRRAYSMARKGEQVDIDPRPVEVFGIELTQFNPPDLALDIVCGSGTYVRSIGRDLGERLGCGAIMTSLHRLQVGHFDLASCHSIDSLDTRMLASVIQPPLDAVADLPRRVVSTDEICAVRQGKAIAEGCIINAVDNERDVVLVDSANQMVAMSRHNSAKCRLEPCVVLPPSA